jgi:dihydrofolate reductase
MKPKINIVAAFTRKSFALGNNGKLLFHISDDLKRFKSLTLGHPIIMGRKTYQSLESALPGRTNYVVTRNHHFQSPDAVTCKSINDAISQAITEEMRSEKPSKEIFIIGGGEIYAQTLPAIDKLYLTIVESDISGDTFFPNYDDFKNITFFEKRFDEKTSLAYQFFDLER